MKLFLSLSLLFLVGTSAVADGNLSELNKAKCVHYASANQNPSLSVSFRYRSRDNDFVSVTVSRRVLVTTRGRLGRRSSEWVWRVTHRSSEQVAVARDRFLIGIDGFAVIVPRPVPVLNTAHENNGSLRFDFDRNEISLVCEKIE